MGSMAELTEEQLREWRTMAEVAVEKAAPAGDYDPIGHVWGPAVLALLGALEAAQAATRRLESERDAARRQAQWLCNLIGTNNRICDGCPVPDDDCIADVSGDDDEVSDEACAGYLLAYSAAQASAEPGDGEEKPREF